MEKAYNNFKLNFNSCIEIRFKDRLISSDTGSLLSREVDDKLGLIESLSAKIEDHREVGKIYHQLTKLLRQRIYSIIQGYRDQNDAARLKDDSALAVASSDKKGEKSIENELASQVSISRLGLELLSSQANREKLREALIDWTFRYLRARGGRKLNTATIDIDSSGHEVYGDPQGAEYNAYFGCKCYHPLYAFLKETGTMLRAKLRPGNVHSSASAVGFVDNLIDQVRERGSKSVMVRGDAGMVTPEMMDALEDKGVKYAFRVKINSRLEALSTPYLDRINLEYGDEKLVELKYQADSWSKKRRVVLVMVQNNDELFPDYFFLVTNFGKKKMSGRQLLDFYRQRGTFEALLGEFKHTIAPKFSSLLFETNEAHLLLFGLSYNLMRIMALMSKPQPIQSETGVKSIEAYDPIPRLSTVRDMLLKVAGRLIRSGRKLIFDVPKTAILWWSRFFHRLERLNPAPG